MRSGEFLHSPLREVRMDLDLVDRRHHLAAIEQSRQALDHEVADPNGADLAVREQGLESAVGL